MKNPFKKQSIIDTLTNVGIGGAANVAIDYIWAQIPQVAAYEEYKDAIKIVGGAVAGSMLKSKYARAAADGVATVGVSNLVASMIAPTDESGKGDKVETDPTKIEGLPGDTIGRIRRQYGSAEYARRARKSGRMAGLDDFLTE